MVFMAAVWSDFPLPYRNPCFCSTQAPDVNERERNERLVLSEVLNQNKKWHFSFCFASCLILGNADNQQGRGVKCIMNYWEGATSLLELILMPLLLPLWVMWGVKYFSGNRGAPQNPFAYQINSRARRRCQPRQLLIHVVCKQWRVCGCL